jgi:hypothetical protein
MAAHGSGGGQEFRMAGDCRRAHWRIAIFPSGKRSDAYREAPLWVSILSVFSPPRGANALSRLAHLFQVPLPNVNQTLMAALSQINNVVREMVTSCKCLRSHFVADV